VRIRGSLGVVAVAVWVAGCTCLIDVGDPNKRPCQAGECLPGYSCIDNYCVATGDAGSQPDSGISSPDAGQKDSGVPTDAGLNDAGFPPDSGVPPDAGVGLKDGGALPGIVVFFDRVGSIASPSANSAGFQVIDDGLEFMPASCLNGPGSLCVIGGVTP
jgi:hypothetical protein